jgi:hypothetical protein
MSVPLRLCACAICLQFAYVSVCVGVWTSKGARPPYLAIVCADVGVDHVQVVRRRDLEEALAADTRPTHTQRERQAVSGYGPWWRHRQGRWSRDRAHLPEPDE